MATKTKRITRRLGVPSRSSAGVQRALNMAAVDRLMWRVGFGPTEADRKRYQGRSLSDVIDEMLEAPRGRLQGPPPAMELNPAGDDDQLVLDWLDKMMRGNQLNERLALFWHDHFATQRAEVSPPQLLTQQIDLFRDFSDFAGNPRAKYDDFIYAVGEGPAMLRFLNGESSTPSALNENYAREICELFALGVSDIRGIPNYSEADIREIGRAFTGWVIDDADPDNAASRFLAERFDAGEKTIFGVKKAWGHRDTVDHVLKRHAHARFLLTKLWENFIVTPPSPATMSDLIRVYRRSKYQLKPVLRRILTDPMMLESVNEPNMIKPPAVYVAGLMRGLGLPIVDTQPVRDLESIGQVPYFPPTVAGWEGGLEWVNTNTVQARFNIASRLLARPEIAVTDPGEQDGLKAFRTAHAATGRPWMSRSSSSVLSEYAKATARDTPAQRVDLQLLLRAFMLGGPDAQVM